MVPIYIALVAVSLNNEPRMFRRPSNLPFPSPVGTLMGVPDCEVAVVRGYYHDEPWKHPSSIHPEAFYVLVSPTNEQLRIEVPLRERDFSKFFGFADDVFEYSCTVILESGWEEVDAETTDYISDFFNRS